MEKFSKIGVGQESISFQYDKLTLVFNFIEQSIKELQFEGIYKDRIIITMPKYLCEMLHYVMQDSMNHCTVAEDCNISFFGVKVNAEHFENSVVVWYKDAVIFKKPNLVKTMYL